MAEALDLTKEGPVGAKPQKLQGKKPPRTGSAPYATVPLPPCKICGGSSTGYHFGAITCEACKAFFRRALMHKQEYRCTKNDDCEIVVKKLGNCSACRLKKCFSIGMSKGGVRKGRYSIAIRTKAIVEAKASKGSPAALTPSPESEHNLSSPSPSADSVPGSMIRLLQDSDSATPASPHSKSSTLSPDRDYRRNVDLELLIDALVGCQDAVYPNLAKQYERGRVLQAQYNAYEAYKSKEEAFCKLFGRAGNVSTEEYQQIFAETGIDLDDRLSHFNSKGKSMEDEISQYVNFTKIIPGFKNLNPKDVSNLLKASHLEFWLFGNYMLFNKKLETALRWDGAPSTGKQMEKFFPQEWVQMLFKFADRIQQLQLSLEEIVLIRVIILTYTDRCKLKDRSQIEVLQEKFLDCLNYQLLISYRDHGRRLYKIFDILLAIRDFTEYNFEANKKFLKVWGFMIHEFPLWKEMLSYENDAQEYTCV